MSFSVITHAVRTQLIIRAVSGLVYRFGKHAVETHICVWSLNGPRKYYQAISFNDETLQRVHQPRNCSKLCNHAHPFPIRTVFADWRCKQQRLYF